MRGAPPGRHRFSRTDRTKRKRQGRALPSFELEAGYFLSIFLSDFFFSALAFFSPLAFFSILLSPFLSIAPACDAAKAETLTAANIAATINESSLFISLSFSVRNAGKSRWTADTRNGITRSGRG